MDMRRQAQAFLVLVLVMTVAIAACKSKAKPPVARPMPPPFTDPNATGSETRPPAPPVPVNEPVPVMPPMPSEDAIGSKTLDALNRDCPPHPVCYELGSCDVSREGQQASQ